MGDRKLETVAREVFLSIPPDVRTGVFIDVFTPCDWHHAARCMVDYRFCFGEKASSSSVSRMNRLRLSLVVYVAFDYAFAVPSHGFAIVSGGP